MDSRNQLPLEGSDVLDQNGVHSESPESEKPEFLLNADATSNGSTENNGNDTSVEKTKKGSQFNHQSNLIVSMVKEVKNKDLEGDNLCPANVSACLVKKKKDGNVEGPSALPNGPFTSRPKQPIKSKSLIDKKTQLSKSSQKSDTASCKVENSKLKPLRKGVVDVVEGGTETTTLSAEDATCNKTGRLPNYGFSFRCDERAEKRREYYSKLEEKIHAKEAEKSDLQAKTKESQEAEIKMLRKSLTFKATPMPSFYQEPPPPKIELKKIPTTRAKSPKFGRRKSFTTSESEENASSIVRPDRLSLDEKSSQNNPPKGVYPVHVKKPQRKSLPHLPSERTAVSRSKVTGKSHAAKVMNENNDISNLTHEEKSPSPVEATQENGNLTEPNEDNISPTSTIQDASMIEMLPEALGIPSERETYQNGHEVFDEQTGHILIQELVGGEN